jgi:hypothetical protein
MCPQASPSNSRANRVVSPPQVCILCCTSVTVPSPPAKQFIRRPNNTRALALPSSAKVRLTLSCCRARVLQPARAATCTHCSELQKGFVQELVKCCSAFRVLQFNCAERSSFCAASVLVALCFAVPRASLCQRDFVPPASVRLR